jgi:hypothetical protein
MGWLKGIGKVLRTNNRVLCEIQRVVEFHLSAEELKHVEEFLEIAVAFGRLSISEKCIKKWQERRFMQGQFIIPIPPLAEQGCLPCGASLFSNGKEFP